MKLLYCIAAAALAFQLPVTSAYSQSEEESGFTFPGQVPGKQRNHALTPKPQPQPLNICPRVLENLPVTNDKIRGLEEERAKMLAAVNGDTTRFSEKEKRKYNVINGNINRLKRYVQEAGEKCSK